MLDWNRKTAKDYLENVYPQKLYRLSTFLENADVCFFTVSANLQEYKTPLNYFGRALYTDVRARYLFEQIHLRYTENLFSQAQTPKFV